VPYHTDTEVTRNSSISTNYRNYLTVEHQAYIFSFRLRSCYQNGISSCNVLVRFDEVDFPAELHKNLCHALSLVGFSTLDPLLFTLGAVSINFSMVSYSSVRDETMLPMADTLTTPTEGLTSADPEKDACKSPPTANMDDLQESSKSELAPGVELAKAGNQVLTTKQRLIACAM
jgi:hypothetical protein